MKQVSQPCCQRYHNIYFCLVRTDYVCCAFSSLGFTHYIMFMQAFRTLCFDATAQREVRFFTASHKIIATFCGRLRSLPLAPNNVIAFQIAQALNLTRPSMNLSRVGLSHGKPISRLQPPSKSMSELFEAVCKVVNV